MICALLIAGLSALQEYIALHVITCLVPAFLLAGAMMAFLSRESILRIFGSGSRKMITFPLAAISGIFLAVCSCTVIPISAGIYRRGGSIGPAFILLWTAPATNILAIIYTGAILGYGMAAARIIAALAMASVVGLVMVSVFRKEAEINVARSEGSREKILSVKDLILLLFLLSTLLLPNYLGVGRPYLHKVCIFLACIAVVAIYAMATKGSNEIRGWLGETWWFVRLIFPLLLLGVFMIGIIGEILPEPWIAKWLGGHGILPAFIAALIGAISYFATLTEAPFVDMLMRLGMGTGPALSLLLAGPGLSLPNMLAIWRVFGSKKTAVYVLTTVILATVAGYLYGLLAW
ncbi:MAG: permease [Methanocellales archaeon]|nr:permease [Methanocellales archaeon]